MGPSPLPSAHLEQGQLAPWLSPQLGETCTGASCTTPSWHGTPWVALTGAGLQQEWSAREGESGVSKNAFDQEGWAGGSKEMIEKCTERVLFHFSHPNSILYKVNPAQSSSCPSFVGTEAHFLRGTLQPMAMLYFLAASQPRTDCICPSEL